MLQFSRDEENVIYVADSDTGEQLFAIGVEETLELACYAWGVERLPLIVWLQLQAMFGSDEASTMGKVLPFTS